jgi:hydrophobe/amphiphile efflux-1 (HAE1) family protein
MRSLPLEQFPVLTPPTISITTQFPGATATTVADSVAAPLEDSLNGTEGMIYMLSQTVSPGYLLLNLYFDIGTNPNFALTDTQNRVNLVQNSLPEEVRKQGITVKKELINPFLFIAIQDPTSRYDDLFVANYASINIVDALQRIKGVSTAEVLNARDYSMRIWLKPDRLAQFSLTTADVTNAVMDQSSIHNVGLIGQEPTLSKIKLTLPISTQGRLSDPKQFEEIILRANSDGSKVILKDVGSVELGAQNYELIGKLNEGKGSFIRIYLDPDANALDVAKRIKKTMNELTQFFPPGIVYSFPYDTSKYISLSIGELEQKIIGAALFVGLVILIFLQSLRATLVPMAAMLVSVIGTFIGVYLLGFSINTLTLFGLVLAIGIVVDDAIVVVENIERNMRSLGLTSKEAAIKTMKDVSRPIIAITLILCAVFIPVAFTGGFVGKFYKQFALTIALSVFISGFVSLTLSPVLSNILIKKLHTPGKISTSFNQFLDRLSNYYTQAASWLMERKALGIVFFLFIVFATFALAKGTPTGLIPNEDQGTISIVVNLPDGATIERTEAAVKKATEIALKSPAVQDVLSFSGWSLMESIPRSNRANIFVTLKDWGKRKQNAFQVIQSLNKKFSSIPDAEIIAMNPPQVPGLGLVSGFSFWVLNQSDIPEVQFQEVIKKIVDKANEKHAFQSVSTNFQPFGMEYHLDIDTEKALSLGVNLNEMYQTLNVLLGSTFINYFNKYGKVFKVVAQADSMYRENVEKLGDFFVRTNTNEMIPLTSFINSRFTSAPPLMSRFNGAPAALITIAPKGSPTRAIATMEKIANEFVLPGMSFTWGGLALEEKQSGGSSSIVLLGGIFVIFLVLAALYERWTLPFAILLVLPFAMFGAFLALWLRVLENNIYFQLSLLVLVGVSAKNAILIVEFARMKKMDGLSTAQAALAGLQLRFRAIIMTSMTLIIGALPLLFSSGAGAAGRTSVGTGIFGGMLVATFLGIIFVPLFFTLIEDFVEKRSKT